MSLGELFEWIAMIAVIVGWWPLIFLGWYHPAYRYSLYIASAVILGIILVRRIIRLEEGFRYSRKIVEMQEQMKYGPRPPFLIPPPSEKSNDNGRKRRP